MLRCAILVVAAAAAFFVPVSGLAQVTVEERLAPEQPPVIIAHRTLGGNAPENSLAGIQYAIERGIDMVEVDVQITHEGNYILMHDTSLTRTTNVDEVFPDGAPSREPGDPDALRYLVSDYTLEDIAQLRLLDPNGGDHTVPTLDAALDAAEGRLLVILDLKRWDEVSLVPLLERRESSNILLYSQTYQRKLAAVADAAGVGVYTRLIGLSDYDRGMNIALERFGPQLVMISVSPSAVTQTLIETGEERGVRVGTNGLGFQDQKQRVGISAPWLELLETGAAAFTTQLPDEIMDLLER